MMTRQEAEAIYDAGREAVVHVLLEMDRRIHALERQVEDLTARLDRSDRRVRELEAQLAKNSRNSGKPPSSDGYKKPAPKSLRTPHGRKPGGQPGHTGHTLKMADKPDFTEVHQASECTCCGGPLDGQCAESVEKRQVHDLPALRLFVTEHRAESQRCACGHLNKAAFPEGINAPVQYGAGIKAAVVYLNNYQLLPHARTCELLGDLFACPLSEGTLANILDQSNSLAATAVEQIKETVAQATVAHFDETGSRVEGKLWWLHTASTGQATYYDIHRKRGGEALDAIDILPGFSGRAIHDFWKAYFGYDCDHALCNAHHLRELTFIHEQHEQDWAKRMIDCLLEIKEAVDSDRGNSGHLHPEALEALTTRYRQVLDEGYAANPLPPLPTGAKKKRGRRKKTQSRNLLERLDAHQHEVLAFMHDFKVPFDNNQAERDLRMMKVRQKISGTFRTEEGAKTFCRLRSYLSTARKNSVSAMDALKRLFSGNAFVPSPDTS